MIKMHLLPQFMQRPTVLVPGTALPTPSSTYGGGICTISSTATSTLCGPLQLSNARSWIASNAKRYVPQRGDVVIGIVRESMGEYHSVDVLSAKAASLDALAFDGASKRNFPVLQQGGVVLARVLGGDAECVLTCEGAGTGRKKDWTTGESQFGELKMGCLFKVNQATCRRLLERKNPLLEALGRKLAFEIAVGMNGRVWVNAQDDPKIVLVVGSAIRATQGRNVDRAEAEEVVKRMCKSVGLIGATAAAAASATSASTTKKKDGEKMHSQDDDDEEMPGQDDDDDDEDL